MSFLSDMIQSLRTTFGEKRAGESTNLAPIYGSGAWWNGNTGISQEKLMREARGWVYACVTKIAEEIGASNLRLYRKSGSRDEWQELEEHPLLDLLNAPNERMPRFELFQLWSMHEDLTGNAYWRLVNAKTDLDTPEMIVPLNPGKITPVYVGDALRHYKYAETPASDIELKPHEVIHFRRPNPNNAFIGLGPTEAAADAIDADNWAREWNRRFFQNAGRPGLVLETEITTADQLKLLRESFDDRYSGASKSHKTAVLPKGVKISDKGFSQKDMDFAELRRQMRDEILAHFGVPHVVLGLGAGENLNRATAETTDYVFSKRTIRPKLVRFVTFLNEFLVPRYGDNLVLEFDDPVPQNTEMQIRQDQAALANAAYQTINEVRIAHGLPAIEGGDTVYGMPMAVPIGSVEPSKSLKKTKGQHKTVTMTASRRAPYRKSQQKRSELAEGLAKKIAETLSRQKKDLMTQDWQPVWEGFVKRVSPHQKTIKDLMAEYAGEMGKRAMEALEKASKSKRKAVDPGAILDEEKEVSALIRILSPEFERILEEEGTSAALLLGEAFNARDERIQEGLKKSLELLAKTYTEESIKLIDEQLTEGLADGESLNELSDRIRGIQELSSDVRADRVAKTESFRIANYATREAWRQTGVVNTVQWYTAEDERVCPFCGPMNGKTVAIDKGFFEEGETIEGEDADGNPVSMEVSYSDVQNPPLHPNCRCYIRPDKIEI